MKELGVTEAPPPASFTEISTDEPYRRFFSIPDGYTVMNALEKAKPQQ